MKTKSISIRSKEREEMIDITGLVGSSLKELGISDGIGMVYVPHTTAGVIINEGADPDVAQDILNRLATIAPRNAGYRHSEGNSDAHIKSAVVGQSVVFIVKNSSPLLGTWQRIFFCEFDGPRSRNVILAVIGESSEK